MEEPGNYIFAAPDSAGEWFALYIGQSSDLGDRLSNHEKEEYAIKNGATHIHAHINSRGEQARLDEEEDLIKHHLPLCNKRL